jgi:hypothetical protein
LCTALETFSEGKVWNDFSSRQVLQDTRLQDCTISSLQEDVILDSSETPETGSVFVLHDDLRNNTNPSPFADNLLSHWDKLSLSSSTSPRTTNSGVFQHPRSVQFVPLNRFAVPGSEHVNSGKEKGSCLLSEGNIHKTKPNPSIHQKKDKDFMGSIQCDNFVTPQGKLRSIFQWIESKPADPNCISHLREKLFEPASASEECYIKEHTLEFPTKSLLPVFSNTLPIQFVCDRSPLETITDLQSYNETLEENLFVDKVDELEEDLFVKEIHEVWHLNLSPGNCVDTYRKQKKWSHARRKSRCFLKSERLSFSAELTAENNDLRSLFTPAFSPILFNVFSFILPDLHNSVGMVSKIFYLCVSSFLFSTRAEKRRISWKGYQSFVKKYSRGFLVGAGACKSVYCLESYGGEKTALGVVDVVDLTLRGLEEAIHRETEISLMCSTIADLNISPCMVKILKAFYTQSDISLKIWERVLATGKPIDSSAVLKKDCRTGSFLYVHMEYCDIGDLETFIREIKLPSVEMVRSFLFQMFFGLFCCRALLTLRHFDIKLLNFFLQTKEHSISFCLGSDTYCIPETTGRFLLVKLGDFGSAETSPTLFAALTPQHVSNIISLDTQIIFHSTLHWKTRHQKILYWALEENRIIPVTLFV